jgi:hypothetical protein
VRPDGWLWPLQQHIHLRIGRLSRNPTTTSGYALWANPTYGLVSLAT